MEQSNKSFIHSINNFDETKKFVSHKYKLLSMLLPFINKSKIVVDKNAQNI